MLTKLGLLVRSFIFWLFPTPHVMRVDWRVDRHDTAETLLEVSFRALCNYVEIEKALIFVTNQPELKRARPTWYNWPMWRKPEYGLMRLREESGFHTTDNKQSETAKLAAEIITLYEWWTKRRKTVADVRAESRVLTREEVDTLMTAELAVSNTDQAMYLRLAAIRPHLVS